LDARAKTQITVGGPFYSQDGRQFNLFVTITNFPAGATDAATNLKEITIEAKPTIPERDAWLQNLDTSVTFQRVRSN
jgi:hypothetical protein